MSDSERGLTDARQALHLQAQRLNAHVARLGKAYPAIWRALENVHAKRETGGPALWPQWCYVPMAAPSALLQQGGHTRQTAGLDAATLAALAAWRMTKGVYRFDPDLLAELWACDLKGDLPGALLQRLPAWAVYIEAPPALSWQGQPIHGAFVHLEYDVDRKTSELRLLLDHGDTLMPLVVQLGGTLKDGVNKVLTEGEQVMGQMPPGLRRSFDDLTNTVIVPFVSCTLYLCSPQADYAGEARPSLPLPKKVKGGSRLFPADRVTSWEVGVRVGAALRRAKNLERAVPVGASGKTLRPHLRATHWQHYWVNVEGKREPVARLKLPTFVNQHLLGEDGVDALPVVLRRVKG